MMRTRKNAKTAMSVITFIVISALVITNCAKKQQDGDNIIESDPISTTVLMGDVIVTTQTDEIITETKQPIDVETTQTEAKDTLTEVTDAPTEVTDAPTEAIVEANTETAVTDETEIKQPDSSSEATLNTENLGEWL